MIWAGIESWPLTCNDIILVVLHDIWVSAIITLSKRFAVNLKKSYHQDEGLSTVVLIVGVASDMALHSLPGKKNINM